MKSVHELYSTCTLNLTIPRRNIQSTTSSLQVYV